MPQPNTEHDHKAEQRLAREKYMSEEEIAMCDDLLRKVEDRRGDYSLYYDRWDKEEEAYGGEQVIEKDQPNSRVNIVNANIEGQVAALVEQNLAVATRGEGPGDQPFAEDARIGLDWTLRKNKSKRLLDRHEHRRELFGTAWLKVYWDEDAVNGFGLATLTPPPNEAMFVDGKITDPLRLQEADYLAEVVSGSKSAATEEYGDIAECIRYGNSDKATIFQKASSSDDDDLYWLVQVWSMSPHPKTKKRVLRFQKISDDGVLLYDSFKEFDGKHYKDKANPKPFYRRNRYPYFLTIMYYEEGKLFGFGDGKLLRPLQDMLNDLYDQARRAARPGRILFDEGSDVELEDLMDDTDTPVPCRRPNETVRQLTQTVNPDVWRLVDMIHVEVQRVIRFSELMLSMSSGGQTATESAIQQQQGASGVDHKKLMLQETLTDVCEYALDLMMEHYRAGRAFRVDDDKEEYRWIDFRSMNKVPAMIPADRKFVDEWKSRFPDKPAPEFMELKGDEGKAPTKSVDLDIEVTIGAGLPKNKAFLYTMLEKLGGIIGVDKQGVKRPVLYWEELRKFFEDFLGLPLDDEEALQSPAPTPTPQVPGQPPMPQGALPSANAQGMTAGGAPQMPVAVGGMR